MPNKDVMASGRYIFAPSFTQPQTQEEDQQDVYQPTMDEEEGSGDSKEEFSGANPGVSTGVINELASSDLSTITPPIVPTDAGSPCKRKRGEGLVQKKKQKISASKQIADAISVIAKASKDRAAALNEIKGVSVKEVMTELLGLEEVQCDADFRVRCIKLLMNKACREMFVALKGKKVYLIEWLRFMVDNP